MLQQFKILIEKITSFSSIYFSDNNNYRDLCVRHLNDFALKLTTPQMLGDQSNDYFATIKFNLEKICFVLDNTANFNPTKLGEHREIFKDLIENIQTCGSGVFTHLSTTVAKLFDSVSLTSWLAEYRLCSSPLNMRATS